jgi:hypothetical protein
MLVSVRQRTRRMSALGQKRRFGDVHATSGVPPITAEEADIPVRLRPLINCADRTSRHSPWCSYQRLLSSSSTPQPMGLARDLSLSRRSR